MVDGRMASEPRRYREEDVQVAEKSLYERLGGVFAIAAVVDHFSDAVVKNMRNLPDPPA